MELIRLWRVLRDRWLVVVNLSLVGVIAAVGFTALANRDISTTYEALIPIRFEPGEGETVDDLEDEVEDARALASLAARDLLVEYPNASIYADPGSGRLIFLAQGETTDEALARATDLVEAYFETDPVVGGDVTEQLAELEALATELQARIDDLDPSLTPEEQQLVAQYDLLDRQIQAVEARIVALTVADATATDEEKVVNAAERANLEQTLSELKVERSLLDPRPVAELSAAARLRRDALQRRLDLLSLDYERLALRTLGVASGGRLEPAVLSDLSQEPSSPLRNGVMGLLGGFGLALASVAFIARARGEYRLPEDLPIPVLAEVPSRKPSTMPGPPWYDTTPGGYRKQSIQALRNALEGAVDSDRAALAILSDRVDGPTNHALAIDLGTAFAIAGRAVLVVDADYEEPDTSSEFSVGEPTLSTFLSLPLASAEMLTDSVSELLDRAVHIRPDLAVIPAGSSPSSPADSVAGSQFRAFLEAASERFDLVVVVAGSSKTPAAQVVTQRVGRAVITAVQGRSTSSSVGALVADLVQQRVDVLGAVGIHGWERKLSLSSLPVKRDDRSDRENLASSPTDRLSRYPFPTSKTSGVLSDGTMRDLANGLASAEVMSRQESGSSSARPDALGEEVLEAIERSDDERAYSPVSNYVVARIEDMMTAVAGQAKVSSGTIDVILRYGFIPLTTVADHLSIGDQLVHELSAELGDGLGQRLARAFAHVLGGDVSEPVKALNDWISREFFLRHIERTGGEPEVWHLTSDHGIVQLLVSARRLDQSRIERINIEIVRRILDYYQRALKEARESMDYDAIQAVEEKLREIHLFEISLGMLQAGSSEEARLVYPWRSSDRQPHGWNPVWSEGIRANIAPLQRLGLLAAPVLSEEELLLGQTTT
jgi:hypothetical protein